MINSEFKEENGIKIFLENVKPDHQDYNAKGLDTLYANEEKHFWFIARKELIFKYINKYINKQDKIIEIGAGTGNVSRYLLKNGYNNISVGEMHLNGLKYAKSYGINNCYQFDILEMPFEKEFDCVCMFDVLEHIEDDNLALKNVNNSLNKNGKIILTVPAHMWLWNRDDTIAGHKIRYNKKTLLNKIESNGFKIIKAKYFFISIVPLLLLRTFVKHDNKSIIKYDEFNNDISMNKIINKILLLISRLENIIIDFLPNYFGGSLLVIAEKNKRFNEII